MKRDVYNYFISMQKSYNGATKAIEKVNKDIEAGLITEEQCEQFKVYYNTIIANYQRVAYIVHLLNKPHPIIEKFFKWKDNLYMSLKIKEELASQEAVEKETSEALTNIEDLSEEVHGRIDQ